MGIARRVALFIKLLLFMSDDDDVLILVGDALSPMVLECDDSDVDNDDDVIRCW